MGVSVSVYKNSFYCIEVPQANLVLCKFACALILRISLQASNFRMSARSLGGRNYSFCSLRIPLIVTDDSGIVTGRSGDRDRRIEPVEHSAL
jgi:hypothetical protein